MKNKYRLICFMIMSCFFLNGCATVMTMSGSPLKEVEIGDDRDSGREMSSNYKFVRGDKEFIVLRQPYCMETATEKIIYRKRMRGVIPAVVEIPLYGLGLVDLVVARQIAAKTIKVEDGDVVETGNIIECGDFRPAENAELVVQCPQTGQIAYARTGSDGEIAVGKLLSGFLNNSQVNVFVREDRCFAYLSTLNSSMY